MHRQSATVLGNADKQRPTGQKLRGASNSRFHLQSWNLQGLQTKSFSEKLHLLVELPLAADSTLSPGVDQSEPICT